MTVETLALVSLIVSALTLAAVLLLALRQRPAPSPLPELQMMLVPQLERSQREETERVQARLGETAGQLRTELASLVHGLGEGLRGGLDQVGAGQDKRLGDFAERLAGLDQRLEALAGKVDQRLEAIRAGNEAKLEAMRATVEEKLQATLNERLTTSFATIATQLDLVQRGVGEMQAVATSVGDLKRVLSNVKARGTVGEVQLGALLEQVLTPSQYERDVIVRRGAKERVDYAIKLPGQGDDPVWLPIDCKFPQEDYLRLLDAYHQADPAAIEAGGKALERALLIQAKSIRDKYIEPPATTDFALMFVPTEGLFAEAVRRAGLVERLQNEHRVVLSGPTTLLSLLNALRMGFRTLAVQKQTDEIQRSLAAVKTEFGRYGNILEKVQQRLEQASKEIGQVDARRRAVDRHLRRFEALPEADSAALLGLPTAIADTGADAGIDTGATEE